MTPRIKEGFKGERAVVLPPYLVEELRNDPLGRELHITDIGYYPHASFHYRERSAEEACEYVLIYCVEGEGWFKLEGRHHEVNANQFFILPHHMARIREACHYLDFTDLHVNQISPLVGYEDSLYFSRLFSKFMGMSPTAYKQQQKKKKKG